MLSKVQEGKLAGIFQDTGREGAACGSGGTWRYLPFGLPRWSSRTSVGMAQAAPHTCTSGALAQLHVAGPLRCLGSTQPARGATLHYVNDLSHALVRTRLPLPAC